MNIVEIVISTIKAKIVPFFTKARMWLKPSYVKNKLTVKFRNFLLKLLDLKPKDENDYYAIGGWLFSKKLAFAVVLIVGILCGAYLLGSKPDTGTTSYRAYKYNSIPLKFVSDKVEILAKSGYTAYVGDVEEGVVSGKGTLYDKNGNTVYTGDFEENAYNGTGKLFYENQNLKYEGEFSDNLYDGTGKEYRDNGALLYEGEYQSGKKEGTGQLYDSSENLVYTGTFHQNEIYYPEMLEKSTADVKEIYTGSRSVYEDSSNYCVYMKDISALYCGTTEGEALSDDLIVSKIYVLKPQICLDGKTVQAVSDIKNILGEPIYQGNTNLELSDDVALNLAAEERGEEVLFGKAVLQTEELYRDVWQINDYEKDYMAYLYVFEKDDIIYQFFCRDIDGGFAYYSLEK